MIRVVQAVHGAFFNKNRTVRKLVTIPKIEFVKLFLFKSIFLFYLIVLPVMLGVSWIIACSAFLIMLFAASIFALIVLLSPHANTEAEFPAISESNKLPDSWMLHMLQTTNDITEDNWFTRFFMGCFNYHVMHHLFPHVNHAYYPEITDLLKKYAQQYDLPYRQYSLWTSLKNHYNLLRKNSKPPPFFEDTM